MSLRRPFVLVAAVCTVLAGACVDDPVEPDYEIPLTEAEAELLGLQVFRQALVNALAASRDSTAIHAPGAWTAPEQFSAEDSVSVACDLGGSVDTKVSVSGTVNEEAGAGTLTFGLVQTHRRCQVQEGDVTFTLNGSPNIALTMTLVAETVGPAEVTGSITGGVTAAVEHRAETCAIDVRFDGVSQRDGSAVYNFAGAICGEDVSRVVELAAESPA